MPNARAPLQRIERQLAAAYARDIDALHAVLKECLRDDNEIQVWKLQKLRDLNTLARFMSGQIRRIVDASRRLAAKERKNDDSSTEKVSLTWAKPSTNSLGKDGKVIVVETRRKSHSRKSLGTEMKIAEHCLEEIRNKKQEAETAFEHLDKMTNETMNTIARLLRALAEMRQEGARKEGGL